MIRSGMLLALLALVPACTRAPEGTPAAPPAAPQPAPAADPRIAPMPREVTRKPLAVDGPLAHQGRQLFLKLNCINCHSANATAKGPLLEGLFGTMVALTDDQATTANEAYITESIRKPKALVVEGWVPIMPAYDEKLATDGEVKALVEYIKSLKKGDLKPKEEEPLKPSGSR